jgi:hypothetical protein
MEGDVPHRFPSNGKPEMMTRAHLSPVWLRIFDLQFSHGEGVYF